MNRKNFFSGLAIGVVATIFMGAVFAYTSNVFGLSRGLSFDTSKKVNQIMQVLNQYYVGNLDTSKMAESMYAGMVYGVGDPYTTYMDANTFSAFMEQSEGTYAGIGVMVTVSDDNQITVVKPFDGAPGALAGMQAGDEIIKINGTAVTGDDYELAVSMMKGQPNTTVTVTVFRPSENRNIDFTITRQQVDVPTVNYQMMDNGIGYIQVTNFDRVTLDQFTKAYNNLTGQNMKALVIDLRNNPGGLLDVVTKMTDLIVPKGYIVYTEDKNGTKNYTYSDDNCIHVPLAVLVNGNSASASEVMAGAIKDFGVGKLVGTQTYGKGVVQNLFDLGDGSAIKVTVAKYYTPSGVCINGEGITPDYIVDMSADLSAKAGSLSLDQDVQLQKAIEVVTGELK